MPALNNPNGYTAYFDLYTNPADTEPQGKLIVDYVVMRHEYIDYDPCWEKIPSSSRYFRLTCTQRIIMQSPLADSFAPDKGTRTSYESYPAALLVEIRPERIKPDKKQDKMLDGNTQLRLLSYDPHTVNVRVSRSDTTNDSSGKASESSISHTNGSSFSETNSYGYSVSAHSDVGATGDTPTFSAGGSVTTNYEHSATHTSEHSDTNGWSHSRNVGHDRGASASMSIKDWGAYAYVRPHAGTPVWVFGQEYPWDAVIFRQFTGSKDGNPNNTNQKRLKLPTSIQHLLYDGTTLNPPSQLSQFGLNFVATASWLVALEGTDDDSICIEHVVNYLTASHALNTENATVDVFMDITPAKLKAKALDGKTFNRPSTVLDLPLMALSPLGTSKHAGVVGFLPSKFIVPPRMSNKPANFKIRSANNLVYIKDATVYPHDSATSGGFHATGTELIAEFSQDVPKLSLQLYCKVANVDEEFTLLMKHWKIGKNAESIRLTFGFSATDETLVKYVEALEAEGGEENILSIKLRDLDYASVNYHDYLRMGLNCITIDIDPVDKDQASSLQYALRSLAIV